MLQLNCRHQLTCLPCQPDDDLMLDRSDLEKLAGYHYHHFPVLASTNLTAFELLKASAAVPLIVNTDRQTAGKGQRDRPWCSGAGSLTFSIAVKLNPTQQGLTLLPVLVGVAVCEAINDAIGEGTGASTGAATDGQAITAKVKWPNDVLIADKKVGGILVQTKPDTGGHKSFLDCVIGIGVNVDDSSGVLSRAVESAADGRDDSVGGFACGDLQSHCIQKISKPRLLVAISQRIEQTITKLCESKALEKIAAAEIVPQRLWRNEKRISVQRPDGKIISGVHEGIAIDGCLLLNCDGQIERICSGSILSEKNIFD